MKYLSGKEERERKGRICSMVVLSEKNILVFAKFLSILCSDIVFV